VRHRLAFLATAGLVLAALVSTPARASISVPSSTTTIRAAAATVPGIDISKWQETIDWPAVDPDNVRFAIMRATKGRAYVDPTYATNLAGATQEGIVVGAYHRATPSSAANDAVTEADHFLSVARNAGGDVLPALDIEETGGLSVAQLQDWVKTWLARVRAKLGVRPMVYASPNFWNVNMGGTKWFATHGYPLWIAHWGVSSPAVPAGDWDGLGWTYWQWTSTGSLSGITTDVDRDRFNGTDLTSGVISTLDVTPTDGGTVSGQRIACGGTSIRCTRLANPGDALTLSATPDAGVEFAGWTGACEEETSSVCTVTVLGSVQTAAVFGYPVDVTLEGTGGGAVRSSPAGLDCGSNCTALFQVGSSVTLTADPDSASGFGSWSGACAGSAPSCIVPIDGPVSVGARFDAAVELDQDGAGTRFAWGTKADARAIGGSYRMDHRAGSSMTFAFRGSAVSLFIVEGPSMGKAKVTIDGTAVATIDGYRASTRTGTEHRFSGLGSGEHILTVEATGTKRAVATGMRVGVDALRWGGVLRRDPRPASGSWSPVTDAAASGGSYVINDVAGATSSLRFTGTGITWITVRGPQMGGAEIWVDGTLVRTVDLYASSPRFDVPRTVTGLTDDAHVVRIVVRGTHGPDATGSAVAVDGWIIR
jgi:GH25 family lysozyme M1 (1,4-beta-N-acetylmuramidase)